MPIKPTYFFFCFKFRALFRSVLQGPDCVAHSGLGLRMGIYCLWQILEICNWFFFSVLFDLIVFFFSFFVLYFCLCFLSDFDIFLFSDLVESGCCFVTRNPFVSVVHWNCQLPQRVCVHRVRLSFSCCHSACGNQFGWRLGSAGDSAGGFGFGFDLCQFLSRHTGHMAHATRSLGQAQDKERLPAHTGSE